MKHHRLALAVWLLSWASALGGGTLFAHVEHISEGLGIYWAIATVETVGYGDVVPHTNAGHYVAAGTMIVAIFIWAFAVALLYSWLTSLHVDRAASDVKAHVTATAAPPERGTLP